MMRDVHPDKAVELIVEAVRRLRPKPSIESIPLSEALGRVLAQPMISAIDHPPFDKSAMDGYAYSEIVPEGIYRVVDAVAAGRGLDRGPGRNEVVKIMTGAPIPPGTLGVQRIERTRSSGTGGEGLPLVAFTGPESQSNIIRRGENLKAGSPLLSPRILHAQDIGILASTGCAWVEAVLSPLVGVISTGDELAAPGEVLSKASIYDSNGPQLVAQAKSAGARTRFYGIVLDRKKELSDVLALALDECDIVIVSGGVSMGDYDLVPSMLGECGVEPLFHGLAMRPGKPTFFGVRKRTAVFGLPGNPVSTFVNFEVLVKPCVFAMMGLDYAPSTIAAVLGSALVRRENDRVEFLPARLVSTKGGLRAFPLAYRGSSMITVLAEADALLRIEVGQSKIDEGAMVYARPIRP